ncbi:hypothetical protein GO013_16300 [Pseudodesulfovibrio sp. JC047]|uniref:hypothetical protein n=1 Tax=Pseudodesulfovibrio sp. JC047 TaxID=2683199 RepID=UPI0013D69C16|nr:hypothetical protein [Pseudodesulfovibrio sp. JC047]NDV20974.1 hypothetical protein [Pseudodesulfovibrio sp. JC047]
MDLPEELIDKICAENPNAMRADQGVILEEDGMAFHIVGVHDPEDYEAVGKQGSWFLPFCSRTEVIRLLKPQTNEDALLKLRAEAMVDSPRLVRVFRKRRRGKANWSLTNYYESFGANDRYLSHLSKSNQKRLKQIPAGYAYLEQANAMCIRTNWGNVIAVSELLQYYFYFMNLFYFGGQLGIKEQDCFHAFLIALRVMGGFESHDFDLDPRGFLDWNAECYLKSRGAMQYDFVLGHEYAHHVLGHLADSKITHVRLNKYTQTKYTGYNHNHKKEYDADHYAIKFITGNNEYKSELVNEAFQVLLYFHLSKLVEESIAPQIHQGTHPSPLSRIKKLRKKIHKRYGRTMTELNDEIRHFEGFVKHFLKDWLPYNMDKFEIYGSFYLPSYKRDFLIDRIDF